VDNNLLDFFIKSSSDLIYEIDLQNDTIKWHKDINKLLAYEENLNLDSLANFSFIIKDEDKNKFLNKINTKENQQNKIYYEVKDALGNFQKWEDTYIKNKNTIIGICKLDVNVILQEHDERNESILDSTSDLIFYKDLDFTYIGCNEAFCKFVGLKKEEILGKDDFELFPQEFAELFRTMDKKMIKSKSSRSNKEWVTYPSGEEVLLLTQKSPLINKNNQIYGLLGISRDITKEINYEKALKDSKKRYKKLFQANKIPVLLISPSSGKIIKANDAALKFYGYTKKEIKNMKISEINTLSEEEINKEIENVKEEKKDCFNFKHKIKSGKVIDVEVYAGPIKYKKEKIIYSVIFDITRRKQAEKKLKQAHTIYQNTKEGIFITDLEGMILSVNKAFEDITGYKEEDVVNKQKANILKSYTHTKAFYKGMWNTLREKGIWEGEIINKTKDSKIFPQWLTINTVYDEEHKPVNYIAVFTDVTKLKEQEKLLREKDQIMFQQSKMASMGEMLRNIAHQWRQPLSVITSSASGLKLKKEFGMLSDADFDEFAEGILKSATYLSETIEDFSNYFKNNKNKEIFAVSDVINKAVQLSDASLKNADIQIDTILDDDLEIYGIKNELIQVLLNIINNSKDAFEHNDIPLKQILISTKKVFGNVEIYIKDNAGGISEKILDKVFEPYFTTKHQSQGTGIGLYMSQQIVEDRLKGSIDIRNIHQTIEHIEYKGVEFKILIPLSKRSD